MIRNTLLGFIVAALGLTVYDWLHSGGIDPYVSVILLGALTLFILSMMPRFNRQGASRRR